MMSRQVFYLFLHVLFLLIPTLVSSQNLAPNPDLEFYNFCPTDYAPPGTLLPCAPWIAATWASTDYLNSCSNPSNVGVPDNDPGWQPAHSGQGYCGLFVKSSNPGDYREYLEGPLLQPLIGGKWYYVSFYVSLADRFCGIQQIGAYFSASQLPYVWGESLPYDFIPQVESNGSFLSDTMNWMLVEGCFQAAGGEVFVTIGNFHTNADTPIDPNCVLGTSAAYYYLDDIYISEVQPGGIDVDLGNDITACYSADLNSNISGVDYYWSTGSTDPSITVSTSGTYYLTVYDGCEAGIDSIDVLITNQPPVQISPSAINICQGGSISVQMDPNAGNYLWNDGSTMSTYIINATGVYTVTLDDGCDITSDDISVTVLDPPAPFSIGGDTLLCTGSELEIFLNPDLGDFTWQNGSTSNSFIINQAGDYAVTISNMCGEASATLQVQDIMPATLDLSVSNYTLCNGESLEISLDTTLGPYLWQDGSMGPDYLITTSGLYSVTMSHYCGPSSDSVLVTAAAVPDINFADTLTSCPGDTLVLTGNNSFGVYTWQDGSMNDSLEVITAGNYALTVVNACGSDTDSVVVLFANPLLPASLGPDIHLCPGDHAVLNAMNTGAQVLWQDGSAADSLFVDTAGIYFITEFNACFSTSDTVLVGSENEPPSISLPAQLTLCQGAIDTLDPGVTGVTYLWNDGTQNSTLIISNPGNYSLTVSNTCGSDIDTIQVFDGGPLPTVSLGMDTSLCPGESITLIPTFNAVDTWLWPDGSSSTTFSVSDSGLIHVIAGNACGITYDTISIDLLAPIPALQLGPDAALCPGELLSLSILFPNVSIQWSDGSHDPDFIISTSGTYYATISNACGISSDTIVVSTLSPVPTLNLGPDQPICAGEQFTITPGIPDVSYLWQDGSTDTFFVVDHNQNITLTISNACGTSTDDVNIFASTNGPEVDLGQDILACSGETVMLMSNINGVNFLWQDGSTNSFFLATTSGLYYLQVSNACGSDIDTIAVDIHGVPPLPALGSDTTLCEGTTLLLQSNADSETTPTWQNGSNLSSFLVNAAGTYVLHETNRCGDHSDTINIAYHPLPVHIGLGPDTVLCPGATLSLNAPLTVDEIMWQDGSTSSTYQVNTAGMYSLMASNICGSSFDELQVTYDDQLVQFPVDDYIKWCAGDVITLDVTQPFIASYQWNTGSVNSSISITNPDIYSVTVITACQQAFHDFEVVANANCDINDGFFIPNVISPNDDNINDVFTINTGPAVKIISMEGSIYDRWGSLVFSSTKNPFTWNGRFANDEVNPGVYVYVLHVKNIIGGREVSQVFAGNVTVIK